MNELATQTETKNSLLKVIKWTTKGNKKKSIINNERECKCKETQEEPRIKLKLKK
jgi:hypothetical protein